jgi:hypothetical protein
MEENTDKVCVKDENFFSGFLGLPIAELEGKVAVMEKKMEERLGINLKPKEGTLVWINKKKKKNHNIKDFLVYKPNKNNTHFDLTSRSGAVPKGTKGCPRNFQGFARTKCFFSIVIGKEVYMPGKYYGKGIDFHSIHPETFCRECFLAPCLMNKMDKEFKTASNSFPYDPQRKQTAGVESTTEMKSHLENEIIKAMSTYFSAAYAKKRGLPGCAKKFIEDLLRREPPKTFSEKCLENVRTMQALKDDSSDEEAEFEG